MGCVARVALTLTSAPAIYGAASAFMSAKRLGHSVTVAEKHHVGIVKVSPEARTIEQAMQVERAGASGGVSRDVWGPWCASRPSARP